MKLTNSCALLASVPLVVALLSGCDDKPLPAIACDTTTLVLSRKAIQSTPQGLRIVDAPDRARYDTLRFTGGYSIYNTGGLTGKSWIYLKVKNGDRLDSISPIGLITSLWNVNNPLPPAGLAIKHCYDTIKAHYPEAN
jgi:hypothetical protein